MAFQKYTASEGKIEVLTGKSAQILNDHFAKNGKYSVSEFNEDQKKALQSDLAAVVEEVQYTPEKKEEVTESE